jgi:HK97 family phage prohead protease
MPSINVVVGPPCAGKSTYVKDHAQSGEVVVDYDLIAKALGSKEAHQSTGSVREVALSARMSAISRINRGIDDDAWIIHTNPNDNMVSEYKKVGAHFILVDPGMDVCLARSKQRNESTESAIRAWYRSPPSIINGLKPVKSAVDSMKGMRMETKRLALDALELKFDDGAMKFAGYASIFNGVDAYGDTIQPGAYKATIGKRDRPIRMRWNHYGPVIGKWVKMAEDEKGLFVEGELTPGHSQAEDVYASLKHGAVDGMSIGYIPKSWEQTNEETRLLKEIHLVEISVVEEPADLGAKVGEVKSIIEACESYKELEALLRDAGGFSRTDAKLLLARMKSMALREAESESETRKKLEQIFSNF